MAFFRIRSAARSGFGNAEAYDQPLYEPHLQRFNTQPLILQPPQPPSMLVTRRARPYKKPGRAVRCKTKLIKLPNSNRRMKRKLCWDAHGRLTSNTAAGARGRVPKGAKKKCRGGKTVCRKWGCKRKRRS
jgi:hypothetical protein